MAQITWPRNGREPLCRSGVAAGALLVGLVSSVVTGETLLNSGEWRVNSGRWREVNQDRPCIRLWFLAINSPLATRHYSEPLASHRSHWLRRQLVEGLFQVAVRSRQVGRLAVKNDLPIMDEKDPVGHRLDLLENVGRNQNSLGPAQVPDQRPYPANLVGIEAAGGLVHDQDLGVMKQRLGHRDPLPIALRELADRLVGH